jgi:hypothetical protein
MGTNSDNGRNSPNKGKNTDHEAHTLSLQYSHAINHTMNLQYSIPETHQLYRPDGMQLVTDFAAVWINRRPRATMLWQLGTRHFDSPQRSPRHRRHPGSAVLGYGFTTERTEAQSWTCSFVHLFTCSLVLGSWFFCSLVLGSRFSVLGSRFSVLDSRFSVLRFCGSPFLVLLFDHPPRPFYTGAHIHN